MAHSLSLEYVVAEEVKKRPLLYNKGDEDWKDGLKKSAEWSEVTRIIRDEYEIEYVTGTVYEYQLNHFPKISVLINSL